MDPPPMNPAEQQARINPRGTWERTKDPATVRVMVRDTAHLVELIDRAASDDAHHDPRVRQLAGRIVAGIHDPDLRAATIQRTVQTVVPYLGEAPEWVSDPITVWETGGDCDDHARLVAALARSIGHPARMVWWEAPNGEGHIVAQLRISSGEWAWSETTIPAQFGESPRDAMARLHAEGRAPWRPDIEPPPGRLGAATSGGGADVEARRIILGAWPTVRGLPEATLYAVQLAQAVARAETFYGRGWTAQPAMVGSHNWGSVHQGAPLPDGTCPPGGMLAEDTDQAGTRRGVCFKVYDSDEAGAADLLRQLAARPRVVAAMRAGRGTDGAAAALYRDHYGSNTCPEAIAEWGDDARRFSEFGRQPQTPRQAAAGAACDRECIRRISNILDSQGRAIARALDEPQQLRTRSDLARAILGAALVGAAALAARHHMPRSVKRYFP
jgi:hypothetical protein